MNPSANGWVKKLLKLENETSVWINTDLERFYYKLRDVGFIYGSNIKTIKNGLSEEKLTEEEICKINFLLALKFCYNDVLNNDDNGFVESVIDFYTQINAHKPSIFSEFLGERKTTSLLETIIHKRIQIDDNIIERSFNYFITNALLFIDVLAYQRFLQHDFISEDYIKHLELAIETTVIEVLNIKEQKTKYDESLIELVEQSLRYNIDKKVELQDALSLVNIKLEKYYIVDIACMATWSDLNIDKNEESILQDIGQLLELDHAIITNSINNIKLFYSSHKEKIALLSSKNIVKTFYSNSSKMVSKLISRNSKRLQKELRESQELVKLLSQSTVRELSDDEQKKVQDQLLDIFKSIPSLAIFMLPGGALLLPLVIKFIPKLLPSSFDDNRIEED
ncbi:LETM1-related biofilm-associated protein [Mangrovimonas cancribranchiae]|uniref:LETM1-related biofilm-associated protein n=1 Tax=Mangrovimonas cancribranchiae TaxID=3080055 RepID=A0AAU6P566_9FLAO